MSGEHVREFIVKVHKEEDHLWAEVLELPGCFAAGDNLEELREALEEAISMYLLDATDGGTLTDFSKREAPQPPAHMDVGEMRVSVAC